MGTLRAHIETEFADAIATGKTETRYLAADGALNPNCWANAAEWDLSGIPLVNSRLGTKGGPIAVHRRFCLAARHWTVYPGGTLLFRRPDGTPYQATISASGWISANDSYILKLTEDLPEDIKIAKVLPTDFSEYLGNGYGIPVATMHSGKSESFKKVNMGISGAIKTTAGYSAPTDTDALALYEPLEDYDSGSPLFTMIGEDLVVLAAFYAAYGHHFGYYAAEYAAAMTTMLGSSAALTPVSLSGFDKIAPDIRVEVSPSRVLTGQTVNITIMCNNATDGAVEIDNDIGELVVDSDGIASTSKQIAETTTFTVTAENTIGTGEESVEAEVVSAGLPVVTFTTTPSTSEPGDEVTVSWTVTGAATVKLRVPGYGDYDVSSTGSMSFNFIGSSWLYLDANNALPTPSVTTSLYHSVEGASAMPSIVKVPTNIDKIEKANSGSTCKVGTWSGDYTNVAAVDETYLTGKPTDYDTAVAATNLVLRFDFPAAGIPAGALLKGLKTTLRRGMMSGDFPEAGMLLRDHTLQLFDGTDLIGDNKADTSTSWVEADATVTYGGELDLWDTDLTTTEANEGLTIEFGVSRNVIQGIGSGDQVWNPRIDLASLTYYYELVAPGAPTIGAVTSSSGSVSVAFTAPASDGGSAITGYTVTSSPGGVTGTGTTSPIAVTGLTTGTNYTFTVVATNVIGDSEPSAASEQITAFSHPASTNPRLSMR